MIAIKKLNQKGFSHHLLVPVLVVVMVTAIGSYVLYKGNAQETATPKSSNTEPNTTLASGETVDPSLIHTCTSPTYITPPASDGRTFGAYYLTNNVWNPDYPVTQSLYACNYNNWYVTTKMNDNSHDGAVKSYPNAHRDFKSTTGVMGRPISEISTLESKFAHEVPSPLVGIYNVSYDLWINGWSSGTSDEIMIWTDNNKQVPICCKVGSFTSLDRTYDVWRNSSYKYTAFVAQRNYKQGKMNLLDFTNYAMSKGWIASSSKLWQVGYGVELVSTDSNPATFKFTNFSVTPTYK